MQGKIVKAIAGFFYVDAGESGIYQCKAKGIFRKTGIRPLVGDNAVFSVTDPKDMEGNIEEILQRKNELIRPLSANVDQALILFAVRHPDPNLPLLDRFLIAMEVREIPAAICFNKTDLSTKEELAFLKHVYEGSGYPVFFASTKEKTGIDEVKAYLSGKTTLLAGPSGSGKSSMTNTCQDKVRMETGEISKKLGRGKNTTRHAELIALGDDSYLMDTPGFTFLHTEEIEKENLRFFYNEFTPYEDTCRFHGCLHIEEPDCKVKEAVAAGTIDRTRYDNYRAIYEELREIEKNRY